jgi:hypothetical protein
MWTYVKWTLRIVPMLLVAAFLHYTLPQHDIVRIIDTSNRPTQISSSNSWAYASSDSGTTSTSATPNIRFIDAAYADNSVMVYRNEDTGWVWPPYFKYDSSTLQAKAGNFKSTEAAPKWVSITHYGWRIAFLSIYPNAVSMKEVAGPDVQIIPYVNIALLLALAFGAFMLRRMWGQFWERMVEPAVADMGDTLDGVSAQAEVVKTKASGFFGWILGWFKPKA